MARTYPKNGPSKTNWEAIRLETYGKQTGRKTKTTMARGCHGRSKKAESQKLEGGSYGWKNLERLGREGENQQRGSFFVLLHAPLLAVILHALLWYIPIQCLEIVTLIITHYEVSLICLLWWIWHFVRFIKRDFVSKFNKYLKYFLTYLLTPWSRVLLEKLTSKLCS